MGSGYNESLAVSRGARTRASSRTPIHFWLDVPMYEYDIGCGNRIRTHVFVSRTPLVAAEEHDDFCIVWCDLCEQYRQIDSREPEPMQVSNYPKKQLAITDELIAYEQDKGVIRERIGMTLQAFGFIGNDTELQTFIDKDWSLEPDFNIRVNAGEIKKINAGLRAPDGMSGQPDLCKAGLHEMNIDNIVVKSGRRSCKACHNLRAKEWAAKNRNAKKQS